MSKEFTQLMEHAANEYKISAKVHEANRETQRTLIARYLKEVGFEFLSKLGTDISPIAGGRGRPNYTSQGRFTEPYDLRNWKWVEANKGNKVIMITLQPREQDMKTKNIHTLVDRLGFRVYLDDELPEATAYRNHYEMNMTDINLPMTEAKLSELVDLINKEIKCVDDETSEPAQPSEVEEAEAEVLSIMNYLLGNYANPYVDEELSNLASSIYSTLDQVVLPFIEGELKRRGELINED